MKLTFFMTVLLALVGCSNIQYVSSDKQEKTISYTGSFYDTESGVREVAEKHCQKPYLYNMQTTKPYTKLDDLPMQYMYTYKCESVPRS